MHSIDEIANATAVEIVEKRDDLLHLGVALLAAFSYVPLVLGFKSLAQKFQTSMHISTRLVANQSFMPFWLSYLRHPSSCINVLKAMYSMCMCSREVCSYIASSKDTIIGLCDILSEKVS
jgi:hypothetical protein